MKPDYPEIRPSRVANPNSRQRKIVRSVSTLLLLLSLATVRIGADSPDPDAQPNLYARLRERRLAWVATTDAWFGAGPTLVYANLQDTRMTPQVYAPVGAGGIVTDQIERENWMWQTTIAAHYAVTGLPDQILGFYQNISIDVETALIRNIGSMGFAAGGAIVGSSNIRLYDRLQNSSFNADIIASIAGLFRWNRAFRLGNRDLIYDIRASVPLSSFVGRTPEYTLFGFAAYFAPPWRFVRGTIETSLAWKLRWSNENRFRFFYRWDMYGMNEVDGLHTLRVGSHTLGVVLGTKRM